MDRRSSSQIIDCLGGRKNVIQVNNCMTRIRVLVGDGSVVNFEKLEKIEVVIRVIRGDTLQIVVGPGRSKRIKCEMEEILGENSDLGRWEKNKVSIGSLQRPSKLKKVLEGVANIFIPLIPAIIAAGLLNGIAGYFVNVYSIGGKVLPLWLTFIQTIGKAFCALSGVASTAFGPSGITAIPLIVPGKIIYYILALGTAYIGGFLITYFFGIPREAKYL